MAFNSVRFKLLECRTGCLADLLSSYPFCLEEWTWMEQAGVQWVYPGLTAAWNRPRGAGRRIAVALAVG